MFNESIMVRKKVVGVAFSLLVISLVLCSYVLAITGSMGNARMILRVNVGDLIERTILVQNVNDVPITIEMYSSGDLENYTRILDNNFTLQPGEEKNARFTMEVPKNGTLETKINVKFSPVERGSGVGLSSTIIVIAKGAGESWNDDNSVDAGAGEDNPENQTPEPGEGWSTAKIVLIAGVSTMIILIILVVLLFMLANKRKTKRFKRADRSS